MIKLTMGCFMSKDILPRNIAEKMPPLIYSQFGIKKDNDRYRMPDDRNDRKNALKMMLDALAANGFDGNKYGAAYWTPLKVEYETLYDKSVEIDSDVTGKVSVKNQLIEKIIKTLKAIVHLIKANYPDTFDAELRKWGFQKGKY